MHVTVVGAGSMGRGIAQVSAMAGHRVRLHDVDEDRISDGIEAIEENLDGGVQRGKVTPGERAATLERVSDGSDPTGR